MLKDTRDRLIELFKKIEYTSFPEMTMKANLGNQFTDYALNSIVNELLANGIIAPPCKVGDKVYAIGVITGQIIESVVTSIVYSGNNIFLHLENETVVDVFQQLGKTIFLTKEGAEKALIERK